MDMVKQGASVMKYQVIPHALSISPEVAAETID